VFSLISKENQRRGVDHYLHATTILLKHKKVNKEEEPS